MSESIRVNVKENLDGSFTLSPVSSGGNPCGCCFIIFIPLAFALWVQTKTGNVNMDSSAIITIIVNLILMALAFLGAFWGSAYCHARNIEIFDAGYFLRVFFNTVVSGVFFWFQIRKYETLANVDVFDVLYYLEPIPLECILVFTFLVGALFTSFNIFRLIKKLLAFSISFGLLYLANEYALDSIMLKYPAFWDTFGSTLISFTPLLAIYLTTLLYTKKNMLSLCVFPFGLIGVFFYNIMYAIKFSSPKADIVTFTVISFLFTTAFEIMKFTKDNYKK